MNVTISEHFCSSNIPFGRENTIEQIRARIKWEEEAEQIVLASDMQGKTEAAKGHRRAKIAYEKILNEKSRLSR